MQFLKNAVAFFAMLAVALAGIFLPGYFLEKNSEDMVGAVRQPDGDYYTGTGALTTIQDMTMEDKLRLTSGVWESKREKIWSGLSDVEPPSLEELKAGTFSGDSDASDQNQDEQMENADELKQKEAEAINDVDDSREMTDADSWETDPDHEFNALMGSTLDSIAQCFREVYPYQEFSFHVNTSPRIYQYSDSYFGTYRCWTVEAGFYFHIYGYDETIDRDFSIMGGTLWLALDLETGELLHVRVVRYEGVDFESYGNSFNCQELGWGMSSLISYNDIQSGEDVNGKELMCYPLSFATKIIADYNTYLLIRNDNISYCLKGDEHKLDMFMYLQKTDDGYGK